MGKRNRRPKSQPAIQAEQGKIAIPVVPLLANPLPIGIQALGHSHDGPVATYQEDCNRCLLEKWWVESTNSDAPLIKASPVKSEPEAAKPAVKATEKVEIPWNAIIALPKPGGTESVPKSAFPYYIVAKDGLYQQTQSVLGRAITKSKNFPAHLPEMKDSGEFTFEADRIPANICSQIVDFFKRIWNKHHTEAEVILLMHRDTREWGILIPTQKTSGAAVDSRVDPEKIPDPWLVVGSMHSHCNFSAFHSGTDRGDAENMNGAHFTIGFLEKEIPEIVAMVAWNGIMFNYKPEELADFSDLNAAKAPEEWDDYVIPTSGLVSGHRPVGMELFEKYPKYVPTQGWKPSESSGYGPNYRAIQQAQGYDPNHGWRGNPGSWRQADHPSPSSYIWDVNHWREPAKTDDEKYYRWLETHANDDKDIPPTNWIEFSDSTLWDWDESIDDTLIDILMNSGLLTDDDLEKATDNRLEASHPMFWKQLFLRKLSTNVVLLKALGIRVDYRVKEIKEDANKKK